MIDSKIKGSLPPPIWMFQTAFGPPVIFGKLYFFRNFFFSSISRIAPHKVHRKIQIEMFLILNPFLAFEDKVKFPVDDSKHKRRILNTKKLHQKSSQIFIFVTKSLSLLRKHKKIFIFVTKTSKSLLPNNRNSWCYSSTYIYELNFTHSVQYFRQTGLVKCWMCQDNSPFHPKLSQISEENLFYRNHYLCYET